MIQGGITAEVIVHVLKKLQTTRLRVSEITIWAMQPWELCILGQRRVAPEASSWLSCQSRWCGEADMTQMSHLQARHWCPAENHAQDTGQHQQCHKQDTSSSQWLCIGQWMQDGSHLGDIWQEESPSWGEKQKAETKNKHKLRWWVHQQVTLGGLSVSI